MAEGRVRVASIDVIAQFRPSVIKFIEEAEAALSSANADAVRTLDWVQREQLPFWKKELRRREEEMTRARGELIRKQESGKADEARKTAVEEKKAFDRAKAAVDQAQEKIRACQRWGRELEQAVQNYKGQVQGLNTMIGAELPNAVAVLDRMSAALEAYTQNSPARGPRSGESREETGGAGGDDAGVGGALA